MLVVTSHRKEFTSISTKKHFHDQCVAIYVLLDQLPEI